MSSGASLNTCMWYAIHTNPRQEVRAENNLKAWGMETYLPKIKESRLNQYDGRMTWLEKPLFLRYFFARFVFNTLSNKIRHARGVKEVVSFGGSPIPVDDEIIDLIRSQHDELGYVNLENNIGLGDEVVITDGVFKGIRGIFERNANDSKRAMILLNALYFQPHLIIDKKSLRRC